MKKVAGGKGECRPVFVFGIDGATMKVIGNHLPSLPTFRFLEKRRGIHNFVCEGPAHSAAAWTTLFTGKKVEEHGHQEFTRDGKLITFEEIKDRAAPFVWQTLTSAGYLAHYLNIPIVLPPISSKEYAAPNASLCMNWEEARFELFEQDAWLRREFYAPGKVFPDFLAVVVTVLDRAQHWGWRDRPRILQLYAQVDSMLRTFLGWATGKADVVILSDHGFDDIERANASQNPGWERSGVLQGDHDREGIIAEIGDRTFLPHLGIGMKQEALTPLILGRYEL